MIAPSLASEGIKLFKFLRGADQSGVSGTGYIAYGLVDHRGKTTLFWRTDKMATSKVRVASISHYDSYQEFLDVHVGSHKDNNFTEIVFIDFKE